MSWRDFNELMASGLGLVLAFPLSMAVIGVLALVIIFCQWLAS